MKKYMKNIIPAAIILLLIIIFALPVGRKVHAQNAEEAVREQREAMESLYITSVKEELAEAGFVNSGVNMTKATGENGEWEYTVVIYHRSFEWMEEEAKRNMQNELEEMGSGSLGKISLTLLER